MSSFDLTLGETFLFYEYVQGPAFNGLEYFNDVEETFDLAHSVSHVFNDLLADGFAVSSDFNPYHHLSVAEFLSFDSVFGLPVQVSATSLEVLHSQTVRDIDIAFFSLEVLHGVDIFWEEVSSGWHGTNYAQGVPYYWFTPSEWLNIDEEAIVVKVNFATSLDRLNMRHTVDQTYDFNNIIFDQFFIYGWPTLAWGALASDGFSLDEITMQYLGFYAHEYLAMGTETESQWHGDHLLSEKVFIYDWAKQIQGFSNTISDAIDIASALKVPYFDRLISGIDYSGDIELTNTVATLILAEVLKAQASIGIGLQVIYGIQDGMALTGGITSALAQDYISTIEDGFGISAETASQFVFFKVIQDAIAGTDSSLSKAFVDAIIEDSTGFEGSVN